MDLSYILILLQLAVALLANPNLAHNAALQVQADMFATNAIALATEALEVQHVPSSTQEIMPTPEPAPTPVQTTVPATPQPVPVQSVIPAPIPAVESSTDSVVLGVVAPMQVPWNILTNATQFSGSVGIGFNGVDTPWGITESSTILQISGRPAYPFNSGALTINGQQYAMFLNPDIQAFHGAFGVQGLVSGQDYPYTIQVNSGNQFAVTSGTISVP